MLEPENAPPTNSYKKIRDQLWFANLIFMSGFANLETIEREITPDKFKQREKPPGGFIYPCKLSKIGRGKLSVSRNYVDLTEKCFPGSSYFYGHPFWDILSKPNLKTNDIIKVIRDLRTKPSNTLLVSPEQCADDFFQAIEEKSNFDSLTAILGICEISLEGNPDNEELLLKVFGQMLTVFVRISAQLPFYYISDNLYRYLKYQYFNLIKNNENWVIETEDNNIFRLVIIERFMIRVIEQLEILKSPFAPPYCLHIAETHFDERLLSKLLTREIVRSNGQLIDKEYVASWPEIVNLSSDLKQWEIKEYLIN